MHKPVLKLLLAAVVTLSVTPMIASASNMLADAKIGSRDVCEIWRRPSQGDGYTMPSNALADCQVAGKRSFTADDFKNNGWLVSHIRGHEDNIGGSEWHVFVFDVEKVRKNGGYEMDEPVKKKSKK